MDTAIHPRRRVRLDMGFMYDSGHPARSALLQVDPESSSG